MPAVQASLWDALDTADGHAPSLVPLTGRVERTVLTGGAWVDLARGWVRGAGGLFSTLESGVGWQAERREMYERVVAVPRLLAWFGEHDAWPHPLLAEARDALDAHYGVTPAERFVSAGLCLYRDGRDSVAWHGDRIGRSRTQDVMVAILSLGAPRALRLRPRGGGPALTHVLGPGDLLVMGGSCQRTWDHCVPKTSTPVGPRISVQFRPRGVA